MNPRDGSPPLQAGAIASLSELLHEVRVLQERVLEAVTLQEGDSRFIEEAALITRILMISREQVNRLKDLLNGGDDGEPALPGEVPPIVAEYLKTCEPSRALRVNHTLLDLVATRYTQLHARAREVCHRVAADLALGHLGQIEPLVREVDEAARRAVAREIDRGLVRRSFRAVAPAAEAAGPAASAAPDESGATWNGSANEPDGFAVR